MSYCHKPQSKKCALFSLIALTYFFPDILGDGEKVIILCNHKGELSMANRWTLSVKTFANIAVISLLINVLAGIFERKPFHKNHVLHSSLASFSKHQI